MAICQCKTGRIPGIGHRIRWAQRGKWVLCRPGLQEWVCPGYLLMYCHLMKITSYECHRYCKCLLATCWLPISYVEWLLLSLSLHFHHFYFSVSFFYPLMLIPLGSSFFQVEISGRQQQTFIVAALTKFMVRKNTQCFYCMLKWQKVQQTKNKTFLFTSRLSQGQVSSPITSCLSSESSLLILSILSLSPFCFLSRLVSFPSFFMYFSIFNTSHTDGPGNE